MGHGPGVEGVRPIAEGAPGAEGVEGGLEVLGGPEGGVDLDGVAPRHGHGPVALVVVAEALLHEAGGVQAVRAHQLLHGLDLAHFWEHWVQHVQVVQRHQWGQWVRRQNAVWVPSYVKLINK